MSQDLALNFEYIAAHINDYIENENLFDTFDLKDIKTIMKYSNLTPKQFNSLLKQSSSTINASKLYVCTRNVKVTIQNINELVSVMKSVKSYLKFKIFDGVIDFLLQNDKERCESAEENKKLREQIQKLQEQIQDLKFQKNRKFLTKITELKISNDFDSVYKLFGKISAEDNQEMMSKACEEGLWKKTTENRKNVLHVACEKGNLQLVKLLIECGCNKETIDEYGNTPLIYASWNNQLEVVKYLISAGANKEAKNNDGKTPLIYASLYDYLNIVKYLVSDGANKDVKNNDGKTPIIYASLYGYLDVVKYLISDGANKETKNNEGNTPLIYASWNNHLEVVKYLISVGVNKAAKDNEGKTALSHAKGKVRDYLKSIGAK